MNEAGRAAGGGVRRRGGTWVSGEVGVLLGPRHYREPSRPSAPSACHLSTSPETAAVTGSRGPGAPPASAHSGHPVSEPVPAQMSHAWAVRGRGHAVCENPSLADGASGPRPSISFSCCSRGGRGAAGCAVALWVRRTFVMLLPSSPASVPSRHPVGRTLAPEESPGTRVRLAREPPCGHGRFNSSC